MVKTIVVFKHPEGFCIAGGEEIVRAVITHHEGKKGGLEVEAIVDGIRSDHSRCGPIETFEQVTEGKRTFLKRKEF